MEDNQLEIYNWGQDVERVFAGVPMKDAFAAVPNYCLLYTSPSPRD